MPSTLGCWRSVFIPKCSSWPGGVTAGSRTRGAKWTVTLGFRRIGSAFRGRAKLTGAGGRSRSRCFDLPYATGLSSWGCKVSWALAIVAKDKIGESGNHALLVGTGDEDDSGVFHGSIRMLASRIIAIAPGAIARGGEPRSFVPQERQTQDDKQLTSSALSKSPARRWRPSRRSILRRGGYRSRTGTDSESECDSAPSRATDA